MGTPLAVRATAQWWRQTSRRLPTTIVVGLLLPLGYLASLGLGIGHYVDRGDGWLAGVPYAAWLAPGLLAATAFQGAATDGLWSVFGAVKWAGQYKAQIATPLRPRDALLGHWIYIVLRMAIVAALELAVMATFGAWRRPTAVLALPAAVLTGAAFAAALMAWAVTRETEGSFVVVQRFVITPLFLFAGTFFPLAELPTALRWFAYLTPLWHGVSLCRGLMVPGTAGAVMAANVAYLGVLAAVAMAVAVRSYERRLAP